jgi:UDPglucose 6-dehydrogenase
MIGFIGQGWVGKHIADDFENRGHEVVRYSLEEEYVGNKDKIADCPIVFVAVPTPTTSNGFDPSHLVNALCSCGPGSTVVIKSTVQPGITEYLCKEFPELFIVHSPEFLVEKTAAYDAANPTRNVVGIPEVNDEYTTRARDVMHVLPKSPVEVICSAKEAELIKYGSNAFLYTKVVFFNLICELAEKLGIDYNLVREMIAEDPRIGYSHTEVDNAGGRGAGGHCFIKDFEALIELYECIVGDMKGEEMLEGIRNKNVELLYNSNKSRELLKETYNI